MKMSVDLQAPYSYPMGPIVLAEIILLTLTMVFIFLMIAKKNKQENQKKERLKQKAPKTLIPGNMPDVKTIYIGKIEIIEKRFHTGELSGRQCYQELSGCVREFVSKVTGENVNSSTLSDITALKMPDLEKLIAGYYYPEFAEDTEYKAEQAIAEAMRVIKTWN